MRIESGAGILRLKFERVLDPLYDHGFYRLECAGLLWDGELSAGRRVRVRGLAQQVGTSWLGPMKRASAGCEQLIGLTDVSVY